MSYQALLFCPDEKTARVVSQVLSELEFKVEPCHEPFAAVKKLMVQHFDALVVDCDNEQNAALLFKSARNSGSNQTSLAVAVVEGQTGVAKAFRLGANLVLTKPIHVEQSEGHAAGCPRLATQRAGCQVVCRGSECGASDDVRAAACSHAVSAATKGRCASIHERFRFRARCRTHAGARSCRRRVARVHAGLPDLQRRQFDAFRGRIRSVQAVSLATAQAPGGADGVRPAQGCGSRGKSEFDAAAPRVLGTPQAGIPHSSGAQTSIGLGRTGAAAAPARAKEIPAPDAKKLGLEPTASAIAAPSTEEIKRIEDPSAGDGWNSNSSLAVTESPSFSSLDDNQAPDAGGSKKVLLIAVVLLGLAAAGYFGWTRMQSAHPQAVPQSAAPGNPETSALPPQTTASVPEAQPATGDLVTPQSEPGLSGTTGIPAPSKPSAAVTSEVSGGKTAAQAKATPVEDGITVVKSPATAKTEPSPALMVHNGSSIQPKTGSEAQESVQAPAVTSIANGTSSSALSGIVNTNVINAQKAPQQTLRISQGVSQGLIIKRVQPVYPPQARQMHLEGMVELQANIAQSGSISSVKQLSGDRILGRAAMDAVRQWKYKPYYLNGEPVEVETQITVNFKLP